MATALAYTLPHTTSIKYCVNLTFHSIAMRASSEMKVLIKAKTKAKKFFLYLGLEIEYFLLDFVE